MCVCVVCQAARLDILLQKAVRARQILHQLQECDVQHVQLQSRFQPLLQQLPQLQAQLQADELSKMTEFAMTEGMREPIMQVTGKPSAPAAQVTDRFGIRIGFSKSHPLALMTWRDYIRQFQHVSRTAEAILSGPKLEEVGRFNRGRRALVGVVSSCLAGWVV
eukprot:jgi/Chrzof1/11131/Cz05g25020.t1